MSSEKTDALLDATGRVVSKALVSFLISARTSWLLESF
jgi:hypothetical protein